MKVVSTLMVACTVFALTDAQFSLSNLLSGLRPLFSRPRTRTRPRQRPQTIFVPAGQFLTQNEQSNFIPQASPATSFLPVDQEVFQQPRLPQAPPPLAPETRPPPIITRPPPISTRPLPISTRPPVVSTKSPPVSRPPSQPKTTQQPPRASSPRPVQFDSTPDLNTSDMT